MQGIYASLVARQPAAKCSFCGKDQDRVRKLVAGPGIYICNECVELCNQIMDYSSEDPSSEGAISPDQPSTWKVYSPHNPAAVELRTLQQQVAYIAGQLAALAEGMEEERGSATD